MYKKYIYKNGKKLGPYYYESKRIGSTIKTVYLGTNPKKKVALPSSKHIIHFTTSFLILLSILGFFFIKNYTGFTVIQPYTDHLNLNINQSQSYTWQLQNPGNLNSLKISGLILGTGKVKISIKNNNLTYVIFDNSKSNLLTGSVIEPDLYSIIDTSKKNKTKEKQPENITENITQPIQNLSENIPVENISISEVYKIVDTQKQENLTNQTTINQSEISQTNLNLTEKAFRFDNICIETCSLIGFNLDSYDIIFELKNTTLILNSIEYFINIPEPNLNAENLTITAEFPENLTLSDVSLQNITNLSITQNLTNLQNLSKLEIKDSKKQKINYSIIKQDKDELDIELSNRHIKTINFKGIRNLTELYIDDIPVEKIKEIKFKEIYSIDPTSLDFDNATITAVATGNSLYKCKEWNSTEQKCYGSWIKLFDLTPGQTYSLTITKEDPAFGEIEITKALHLDQNYTLISDIYEQVKEKDNIWSEPIYNKEYIRVTFYQNLTNKNDITVYVRNLQGFEIDIEVYAENSNEKIVEFPIINNEGYYQVLLTNMTRGYQTFDLKIKSSDSNAYLEFDHIIDPINSVTLNDPTTDISLYSSKWFWMNCTAAKQGQGDTPDSLQFHHNNSNPTMIRIPVNTSSTTLNTSSTNPVDPFSYATMYSINVSTPAVGTYQIQCQANNSAGTTVKSAIRKITVLNGTHCSGTSYEEAVGGDWVITADTICLNEVINISLGANITIDSGGNLTLINSTLNMFNRTRSSSATGSGNEYLNVSEFSNGLWVHNNSKLNLVTNGISIFIRENSTIENSEVKAEILEYQGSNVQTLKIFNSNISSEIDIRITILTTSSTLNVSYNNITYANDYTCFDMAKSTGTASDNLFYCRRDFSGTSVASGLVMTQGILKDSVLTANNQTGSVNDYVGVRGSSSVTRIVNVTSKFAQYAFAADNRIEFENVTAIGSVWYDFLIRNISTTGVNAWIINSSFNRSSINFSGGNQSNHANVSWFIEVYIIDNTTGNPINNANVSFYNSSNMNKILYLNNTDSNGLTRLMKIQEFMMNLTKQTNITPYNITVSAPNSIFNSTVEEINYSRRITISIFQTLDTTSPNFTNIQKNTTKQYQGSWVNFSAKWADSYALSGYIFTWNESGNWINASFTSFSGTSNVSQNISNISAINGTYICWKFYANDSSNNWNMTMQNQCFTINQTYINWSSLTLDLGSIVQNTGNLTSSVFLNSTGINTNANVSYVSGNSTVISHNYTAKTLQNLQRENILFTCNSNSVAGFYTSNFYVNSSEDNAAEQINISCSVNPVVSYCSGNFNNTKSAFNISTNVECANETMDIDGNITISYGNLTLKNITIRFIGAIADGYNYINKKENGGLWIYDNDNNQSTSNDASNISNSTQYNYDFWAYGKGLRDNFTLQNSILTGAGYSSESRGIQLYNVSNISLSGNNISVIRSNAYGLYLQYSSNNNITNNTIDTTSSSSHGIILYTGSSSNTLQNNTITTSRDTSIGIYLDETLATIVNNNLISNTITTNDTLAYGLYIFSSSNNIQNNTIITAGSAGRGIYLPLGSNNVTNNIITTNGTSAHGIYLDTGSNSNTLQNNNITTNGSGGYGVFLSSVSFSSIIGNIISTNDTQTYGLYVGSSDDSNISSNTISSSNSDSIFIDFGSDRNTISINTLKFSKNSAIRIQNTTSGIMSQNNTISNNNITNATNGISIFLNATKPFNINNTIENNNITFTTNAIYISNSSNINISLGTIRNSTNGIVLYNSKQVNATNITFTSNTYDFNITNSSSLTSINNTFNKTVKVLDNSNFTIMWFLDINATDDSNNLLSSANITVYDNSTGALNSKLTYTKQTGTNGLTGNTIVIEYIQNSTGNQTIYIPYNITGSKIDYNFNSTLDYTDKSKLFKFTIPVIPPITYCSGNFNNSNVNFDISTNVVCANESMNINGNITILSGGNLTLKNITIIFQSTADGSRFINKTENGGLWIYDNDNNQSTSNDASNITSNNTNFEYDFWAYGKGLRDNFTLQNSIITEVGYSTNSRGIQFYNISNITIIGNNVSGGSGFGLYMQYSTNNNLTNNNLITTANLGFGFYLISSSNSNTVINNSITTTGSTGFGIYLISSSNSNISRNTITTTQDSGYGIFLNSSSNSNIVSNNSITTSGSSAGYGFRLANSNFNNITNNSITTSGNDSDGFFIVSSNSTLIENNLITMSGLCVLGSAGCPDGIIIRVGDDVNITGTVIDNTNPNIVSGYGISIADASNTSIKNNNITTRATNGYGIYLNGSISNNVINNNATTTGNSGYGIYLISSSNSNTLQSNDITTSNRSSYGIYLFLSSNSNVSSNTISTNETLSYGIYLAASDSNNISLNTINSSNSDSIFLDRNSNNNTISYNTLKFSKNSAIRIQNTTSGIMSQNNTITNNNITNATNGISILMNSTRPFAVNNTIENNNITFTTNAIYIQNSSNINISSGIIRNSTNGIVLFNSKQVNATNITLIANTYDFNITNSSSLTSINNSFNKTVKVLDNSNFTIMWFAEVYVNDNQANTNVSVWNATGVRHGNSTTNSQGLTPLFLLTEYIRNNTDNLTSNNPFNFTASNTTFFNSTSKNITQSQRITLSFLGGANIAPNVTSISLTPSFPNTTINLNCSFVITDPDAGNNLTVNLTWYKNNTINKTYTSISVTNGTLNMHYLNNANTTKNDNWSCGIRPYDQTDWGNELNSSIVTIQNSQPSTPSLTSPADGNKTTNRSETFIWAASTDPDNDPITYTINISCWGGCSADNRLVNITAINYTPAELKYFIDDNYYYNWTVKAIDSDANSSSSAAERNLSLQVLVSLTLPNSTILFGTKNIGDSVNTSNNTPSPIVMQNDGNSYINVNLSAQSTLFTTKPNPSTNYQYKIDNTSLEAGSFNWTGSVTTWTNIPLQNNTAVNLLNYSSLNDTAEMDIFITVPSNEPPGNLTSNLILTGYYIANYP